MARTRSPPAKHAWRASINPATTPQFREWIEEHHRCENRLNELCSRKEVSVDEEIEEKTLKKRKLQLKDQMAARIRSYETSNAMA